MKKGILALIALGLSASAMTGCSMLGQSASPAPAESSAAATSPATPSEAATETPSPEASESVAPDASGTSGVSDEKFTDLIREKTTTAYIMGNNEIVDIAKQTCAAYNEGGNLKTVLSNISERFIDTTSSVKMDKEAFFGDLAYISGAGVANYCPEHATQFKADIDEAMVASKTAS